MYEETGMIPDFKGHHFVEDSYPGGPPALHFHCERCRVKAILKPDGSAEFVALGEVSVTISRLIQLSINLTPACTDVRSSPA